MDYRSPSCITECADTQITVMIMQNIPLAICLGAGITGMSCARFLRDRGYHVRITDDNPSKLSMQGAISIEETIQQLHEGGVSLLVASPGVMLEHAVLVAARKNKVSIVGDIELGFCHMPEKRPILVGVTGTNGKTTVTLLIEHILKKAGKVAYAVGNIGNAFLDEFESRMKADVLIIEVSSQQLEHITTPCFDIGCIVNITPNHLDWHGSMEAYVAAKMRLKKLMTTPSLLVKQELSHYFPHEVESIGDCAGLAIVQGDIVCSEKNDGHCSALLLKSFPHDQENFLFAYGVARKLGISSATAMEAFESFIKPPHRIQFLGCYNGISYYDDSKATSVAAVIRAVQSVAAPIQLIAGGVHKGEPYSTWIPHFKNRVQKVFAIGEAKGIIKNDLAADVEVVLCDSLQDAFSAAQQEAKEGDSILLSPGCSSWDMFASYKERGQKFQELVGAISTL